MNLNTLSKSWISQYPSPLVIAGPCSAESETQIMETALKIKENTPTVQIFRAGIWKPRTKPNGFEGVGAVGLKWLSKVKEELGLEITTEVANANHVKAAIDAGINTLWIGARTTTNPFAVQEIADTLQQNQQVSVWVKNPVNPDLALWIGALERLQGAGIQKIGAVHRGFSTYHKTKYRNEPNWQLAIDFMNTYPNIPLIVDPSHIVGNREGLLDVSQQAIRLGYDGMMIETHHSPNEAWSDAKQQITPERLADIIELLQKPSPENVTLHADIEQHRTAISEIDRQIITLLSHRMTLSKQIANVKKEINAQVFQPDRWREIMENVSLLSQENGISEDFVQKIFKCIHEESIEIQHKIMTQYKPL